MDDENDALSQPFAGPSPSIQNPVEPDNCIKILLATDNHIGYAEGDPVRGKDSINTFREILQLAIENDVDMVLLGGDLFHENRPSRTSLYQTIAALREHCLGNRPVNLALVCDDGIGIARNAKWPGVNYEDENLNIGLPVFSIHGNHDDPQGTSAEGALCALDILSASGLINYFGRVDLPGDAIDDEEARESGIQIKPVLLEKGDTKLALYGFGNIKDERFHYEMKNGRIKMFAPVEDTDQWFNIVLVHQNRVAHVASSYVPDTAFDDEADLIVWGHEHDCVNKAQACSVPGRRYYITQPGSSIATSLAKGEAIPKHVSLLKIQGKEFQMDPIRLRSVRPFIWEDISLLDAQENDNVELDTKVKVNQYLKAKVKALIEQASVEWDELHPEGDGDDEERLLPLIRLRVDYSGGPSEGASFEIGNPQRFGQDFVDQVANPRDVVQFHRKSKASRKSKVTIDQPEGLVIDDDDVDEEGNARPEKIKVAMLVKQYLGAQNLGVLPEMAMQKAVEDFVDKGDKDALSNLLKSALKHERFTIAQSYVPSADGAEHDDMEAEMLAAKQAVEEKMGKGKRKAKDKGKKAQAEDEDSDDSMESANRGKKAAGQDEDSDDSMGSSNGSSVAAKGKGKGKAPPKKPAAKKAAPKKPAAKNSKKKAASESESASDSDIEIVETKKAPAKKPPARATKAKAPVPTPETDSSSEESVAPKGKAKRK